MAIFDTDTNNVLSEAEMTQAANQLLKLDQDNDGQLAADEFCLGGFGRGAAACPRDGQGRGRCARAGGQQCVLLDLFDTDKDGALSAAEINAAPTVLRALDKNNDGQVAADEIRPLPGRGRGCPWAQKQSQ